ncbi:MAG: MFS transporter [Verrucomicrobiota bacterium]|nr:MFS transporter [Verrucomicrobiota bacterium]
MSLFKKYQQPDENNRSQAEDTNPTTGKVSVKEKLAFGSGEFANRYGENGVNDIATPVYNIILGLNPATIGIVLMLMRIWDSVTDPIMGWISDNWRGAHGRRKPFLLLGSILMAIAYPLIWMASPDWTEQTKSIYFICLALIFFTTYTIYSVPFRALATEMTPDYEERTNIRVYSAFFNKLFMFMLPWIFPLSQSQLFNDPVTGIRTLAALSSVLILVSGIICARFPQERYHKVALQQEKVKLLPSFLSLIKDPAFLLLHGIGVFLLCSILLVATFGLYVNMFYVWEGNIAGGSRYFAISQNILQVLGIVMLAVISRYLVKIEKKKLILLSLSLALLGSLARWFTYNKGIPELLFIDPFFFAPAYTVFWAIFLSMLGDYCDYDEFKNGNRREGVFSAISGWIMKAGSSLAFGASGILLAWTHFSKDLGGDQPDGTLLKMRLLLIALPVLCLLLAIAFNTLYPLSKARMQEIRNTLECRRGEI